MKKIDNDFPKILESFFSKHLILERRYSLNTYESYLTTMKQLINFMDNNLHIRRDKITIMDLSKENIKKFLNEEEKAYGWSPKTRNQKLSAVKSFLEYAQSINPVYLNTYVEVKSIKKKKENNEKQDYMTVDEMKAFFSCIDLRYKSGYKHYVILTVLYETGTRVSEVINIRIENLFFNENPYIKIFGKGNKERNVYISDSVVFMINEYRTKFNIHDGYLFRNPSNNQLTRYSINKMIDKYYEKTVEKCPTLTNKSVSPHTFRHSKAVHFLQNDTSIFIIQRFLGHSSIKTTEVYLDITNDVVIEAVKLATNMVSNKKDNAMWQGNEELISLLESLKK
ncbi:MAG: site-specific integrase [Erysipelotrichaceae bacterium]|nr:site-specific integrase [Erysipelotrichaceae bacterium]